MENATDLWKEGFIDHSRRLRHKKLTSILSCLKKAVICTWRSVIKFSVQVCILDSQNFVFSKQRPFNLESGNLVQSFVFQKSLIVRSRNWVFEKVSLLYWIGSLKRNSVATFQSFGEQKLRHFRKFLSFSKSIKKSVGYKLITESTSTCLAHLNAVRYFKIILHNCCCCCIF